MIEWSDEAVTAFLAAYQDQAWEPNNHYNAVRAGLNTAVKAQGEFYTREEMGAAIRLAKRQAFEEAARAVSAALSNHLIDMQPGQDDSITGFNDAWVVAVSAIHKLAKEPQK